MYQYQQVEVAWHAIAYISRQCVKPVVELIILTHEAGATTSCKLRVK